MTCIRFLPLWLLLSAQAFADTTIVPYEEPGMPHHVTVPETSFADLAWVLVKTLLILLFFIGALYLVVLLFRRLTERRFDGRMQGEDIKILERAIISNKSAIYLLEIKGKYVLVGESHNGLSQLGTFH